MRGAPQRQHGCSGRRTDTAAVTTHFCIYRRVESRCQEVACNYLSDHSGTQTWKDARDIGLSPIISVNGPITLRNSRCLVELQRQLTTHNTLKRTIGKKNDSNWWNRHRPKPSARPAGSSGRACQAMLS